MEFLKGSQRLLKGRETIYFNTKIKISALINANRDHSMLIYLELINVSYQFS